MDRPREQALAVLLQAEQGAPASGPLERSRKNFGSRDNAFILELVMGVLRNRSRIDWLLDRFSSKPVSATDGETRNLLRLAAYQLLFLDKVPASAAVNTAVELAKVHGKKHGYVNGLLRNLERNRNSLPLPDSPDPVQRLSLVHSHPGWLVRRWSGRFGVGRTEEILRRNNEPSPLVVRTNAIRNSRDELLAALGSQGAEARPTEFAPSGIEILSSPGLTPLPAFNEGRFLVQDEAAQLVSLLLAPQPGETVLDACAAPGGKATHLAELMQDQGTVVALERDRDRIGRIRENSERLGLSIVQPVAGDASAFNEGNYDRILIDAPCSGLGVLRRHPDGRWIKREKDLAERAKLQSRILDNCAKLLKTGGVLVYATCTTEPEENEDVIAAFLTRNGDFSLDNPRPYLPEAAVRLVDGHLFFRTFPGEPAMDGFFAARMNKQG